MNKVELVGRIVADPDMRFTPNGVAVTSFTIAVNRRFKKENEERKADFIRCIAWKHNAETAANYLKKGFRVGVVGSWFTDSFEGQDGKRVYKNECLVDELHLIDFAGQNGQNSNENNPGNTNTARNQNRFENDPFSGPGKIDIDDSDLPF